MGMANSLEDLVIDGGRTRELLDVSLKGVGRGYPGRMPHVDTVLRKSGIDEYERDIHNNDRLVLYDQDPLLGFLVDFSYLHEDRVHDGRLRKSMFPYTNHTHQAGTNFMTNTGMPQSKEDWRYYANIRIGINRHDSTEELSDDEVARREKAGELVSRQEKIAIRRENLRNQHEAYNTAIDVVSEAFNLSSDQKQVLYELEINNLIEEDKLSRGRMRRGRDMDPYDLYAQDSIGGITQIFGYKSNVLNELKSFIIKGNETGQNGDTLYPHGGWVLYMNKALSARERSLIAEVTRELQLGAITWDNNGPYFEENILAKKRKKLEGLYDTAKHEMMLNQILQTTGNDAKEVFEAEKTLNLHNEAKYRSVLENYLHIIPPNSRADTIQWNAWIANLAAKSVYSASTHPDRKRLVTPWLLETAKSASVDLAERTIVHAQMHMDNEVVYNGFPITKAREIRKRAADFQNYNQSFRVTSQQETQQLPSRLQPYDEFTNWLLRLARKDEKAIREFKRNPEIQFRQMAVASELCYRLLENASRNPAKVRYAVGGLDASAGR